jgi:hypothetical protein
MKAIHWTHGLLDEGPRPKNGKSMLNQHGTILEGKSLGSYQKKEAKTKSSKFEKQRFKLGSKARSNSRIQFASNESNLVPRNLDLGPHLKWALHLWQNPQHVSYHACFIIQEHENYAQHCG